MTTARPSTGPGQADFHSCIWRCNAQDHLVLSLSKDARRSCSPHHLHLEKPSRDGHRVQGNSRRSAMTTELRDKACALGLDRLSDEHLVQFERAMAGMRR